MRGVRLLLGALGISSAAAAAGAQSVPGPRQPWRTLETEHFVFHTPAALEDWTRHVASRMESYAAAVASFVGHAPPSRVRVIVDDPSGDANGFAIPLLGEPLIGLWPTPPMPGVTFGEQGTWGELLAVHEYAHLAHLTYRSRNPRERWLWSLLPARVGPVARRTPPWAFEGFATLVEGRLTGSGRPHSAGRAALLRTWALSGKLPPYTALDRTGSFLGGSMRYLVGSAYLEWLAERKGDSSFALVWRRLSARTQRSFDAAFAGVYGASPADLYGEFTVDVTERALRARAMIRAAGVREGELFQRLAWNTGEPALSPDGKHLAVVLRQPDAPSRVVLWRTDAAGIDSALLRRRARARAADTLDVPAVDSFPLPRRAVATLRAASGAGYTNPRFLADSVHVLLSREMPLGAEGSRADLFLWNWRTGDVRRVTRGAGIRFADPAPDGRRAAAVRCDAGRCGLVVVDLANGNRRALVSGAFDEIWHRPRWSPDGRRIAASVQRAGRWEVAIVDAASGGVEQVLPNETAMRHSPVWAGDDLIVVSDASGVTNLERVSNGRVHPVTNVLGAVGAPEYSAADRSVWYLDLHAAGLDVRRLAAEAPAPVTVPQLAAELAPVAQRSPGPRPAYDSVAVPARGYGFGPRPWRYYPGGAAGADGSYGLLALANTDPAGKLSLLAQGAYGSARTWRGGALGARWRGWPAFDIDVDLFSMDPGRGRSAAHARMDGGALALSRARQGDGVAWSFTLGGTAMRVDSAPGGHFTRAQGAAESRVAWRRNRGLWRDVSLHGTASLGTSGSVEVRRAAGTFGAGVALFGMRVRGSAAAGRVDLGGDSSQAARFEHFQLGGLPNPFLAAGAVPQQLAAAPLPRGSALGHAYVAYRGEVAHPALPLSLYGVWFRVYDPGDERRRWVGGEGNLRFPAIAMVNLPQVSLQYGAAYLLDDPRRYRWTLYAGARFAP